MTRPTDLIELADALHSISWRLRLPATALAGVEALPATEEEVLRRIGAEPGCRVSAVAEALGLQPSNVSTTVRALVARGLVTRESDPADRRAARLRLTDDAQRVRERLERARGAVIGQALDGLAADFALSLLDAVPALSALAEKLSPPGDEPRRPHR